MTRGPDPASAAVYREDHSALTWPLLAWGLFGPVAGVTACVVLGVLVNPLWLIGVPFLPLFAPFLVYSSLLYRNWPTGIRLDGLELRIGAVGSPRAVRRTPTVTHQSRGLFSCPWAGVRAARVVTGAAELRRFTTSSRYHTLTNRWGGPGTMTACRIGVLSAPFMRAALVIDVDPAVAAVPRCRPARYFGNGMGGRLSRLLPPDPSSTWIVPTRRPEALRAALEALLEAPLSR